jgi:3-(3-hydroxy-phenyl)propionate hydroxylase
MPQLDGRNMSSAEVSYTTSPYTNGYEFSQGSGYVLPQYSFVAPAELVEGATGRCKVAIVGAGLSGLTLACALARQGVDAVLLDEDNTVGVKGASSRGICYTQKSLEIFQRLGIYGRVAGKGIQWRVGRTYLDDEEIYAFDLQRQPGFELSEQPPFINIQQFYVEGYLVERIMELGHVELRWSSRVTGFRMDEDGARLEVQTPAGTYSLQADYVVDATGSRSPFRAWTGAQMSGNRSDDRWCIADVRFADQPPLERHTWVEAPFNEGRAVWQHLMGDGVWRIDYQMAPDADPREISREDVVRERLARQFGTEQEVEVVWVSPWMYRSECIDRMQRGRLFFMGDAAKVVSPFGARGGNSGVADADNLAWKLAAVTRGVAPPALLETYHDERHEAALLNLRVTDRTARFMRARTATERLFRSAVLSLARRHAFARSLVNTGRMAVANRYTRSAICGESGGASVQNVKCTRADGTDALLNDLLEPDGVHILVLLLFGRLAQTRDALLRELAGLPVRCIAVSGGGLRPASSTDHVLDTSGKLRRACQLSASSGWALLRPDAYLAAQSSQESDDPIAAVRTALGLAGKGTA